MMGVTYTCDRCGTVLNNSEYYMAKVGIVGRVNAIPDYIFCKDCAKLAKSALHAVAKCKVVDA